jgi:uncharacterized protein YdaU (DUF1376 family)
VNYYQHHLGDYAKDTAHLSLLEHGIYGQLMRRYYSTEAPLPPDVAEVCRLIGARTDEERAAVGIVLKDFFELQGDGHRQKRMDEEIAAYHDKAERNRAVGKLGGRPKRNPEETQMVSENNPDLTLASSHKPVASNQEKQKQRISNPGDFDSAGTVGDAALEGLKALSLQEAKIDGGPETPAAILASVLKANGLRGNAFHPAIVEWARTGITVEKLKDAIAKARQRPGKERGVFGPEYLSPILYDESKPAAQYHAEKASNDAAKNLAKAQRQLDEQRERARAAAPMPEHLRPKPTSH